jgi:hypothetical protein
MMRRIASCAILLGSLVAFKFSLADPPGSTPAKIATSEISKKDWNGFVCPEKRSRHAPTAEELKIERSLSRDVSLHLDNAALSEVIRHLAKLGEVNIVLDTSGLEDEGVTSNTHVSINVDGIRLKSALNLLLEPLRLGYAIKDDVLKITSRMKQQGELLTVTYSVADLVVSFPGASPTGTAAKSVLTADYTSLMNLISTTIQPDSWEELSGPGSMTPYHTTFSLVIRQTQPVHDEIADLLGQLRRLADLAVLLKMTLVTVPEEELRRHEPARSLVRETLPDSGKAKQNRSLVLNNDEAMQLMNDLKQCATTSVIPVPKLCLVNGQTSDLIFDTPAIGTTRASSYGIKIHAVVAGDRKNLRLKLAAPVGDAARALESTISFSARHQETIVRDVTRLLDIYRQSQAGTPRAARDTPVTRETKIAASKTPGMREFLIITPQVLLAQEEEELLGVDLPQR